MLPDWKQPRIELDARCPGLYRRVEHGPSPINPIKTHYENVNDKTLRATGDPSTFLHRYREKITSVVVRRY